MTRSLRHIGLSRRRRCSRPRRSDDAGPAAAATVAPKDRAAAQSPGSPPPRLITLDEAIDRIRGLVADPPIDIRQRLLSIAGVAIAGVITIDDDFVAIEKIEGLQECVNCALFACTHQ
jgi:hypothetical protein